MQAIVEQRWQKGEEENNTQKTECVDVKRQKVLQKRCDKYMLRA